jgi:hypothetical protein
MMPPCQLAIKVASIVDAEAGKGHIKKLAPSSIIKGH